MLVLIEEQRIRDCVVDSLKAAAFSIDVSFSTSPKTVFPNDVVAPALPLPFGVDVEGLSVRDDVVFDDVSARGIGRVAT